MKKPALERHLFVSDFQIPEYDEAAIQAVLSFVPDFQQRRGYSGFSGHTHRLALHMVTQSGITKFWVETGGFFRMKFKHPYTRSGNWQQGFSVAFYDPTDDAMHPVVIPIYKGKFVYAGKTYRGN